MVESPAEAQEALDGIVSLLEAAAHGDVDLSGGALWALLAVARDKADLVLNFPQLALRAADIVPRRLARNARVYRGVIAARNDNAASQYNGTNRKTTDTAAAIIITSRTTTAMTSFVDTLILRFQNSCGSDRS